MTDNEIMKAFKTYCDQIFNGYTAYLVGGGKNDKSEEERIDMLSSILDLIKRQQAENEKNEKIIKIADKTIETQNAEIKRLTSGKCVYLSDDETTEYCVEGPCPNYKTEAQIKVEAYKEFSKNSVERVEKVKLKYQRLCKEQGEEMEEHINILFNGIINLLKGLVGE